MRRSTLWNAIGACLIGLLSLSAVGVARQVSLNAPSSRAGNTETVPRAEISVSQGCQNFADYWLDQTSVEVEGATLEGFTNCRLASDGRWYVLTELPAGELSRIPAIDPAFAGEATSLREYLLQEVEILKFAMSEGLLGSLDKIATEGQNPVIGRVTEGGSLSSVRTRYARIVNAFTLDPAHAEFAAYVGWVMQQRMDAYGVFRRACLRPDTSYLRQPCVGMEDNLSIRYAPWYWELRNPEWLDAYLAARFGSGDSEAGD